MWTGPTTSRLPKRSPWRREYHKDFVPVRRARVESSYCWGIFREAAHSPGRESDDAEILRLTGKHLEAKGLQVVLKTPEEVGPADEGLPRFVFLMCERVDVLRRLRVLEAAGVPHVNSPQS